MASSVRFKFAAHDGWPDLDLYWYDGGMRPPAPRELDEDNRMLAASGMLFIGDKGKILDGRIIPEGRMKAYAGANYTPAPAGRGGQGGPPPGQARAGRGQGGQAPAEAPAGQSMGQGGPTGRASLADWVKACKGGPQSPGNFLNAIHLTEAVNLHAVALRTGQRVMYDPATTSVTNVAGANRYLAREYRKGWEL